MSMYCTLALTFSPCRLAITATIAIFGNQSFDYTARNSSNASIPSADLQIYQEGGISFGE